MPSDRDHDSPRIASRGISSPSRRFEQRTLALVAALTVVVLGFALLAGAVAGGSTQGFDEWLLHALRNPADASDPLGPRWFEEMVRDVTALGSTIVLTLAVIVVALYLLITGKPQKAGFLVAAVCLGALLNRALKFAFARERPEVAADATSWITSESFPSGHTANSAVVYLLLGMMLARVEASYRVKVFIFGACAAMTVMVGMSRIYLGAHWPTDVIAGWAVGACWALVCWYALVWMQPSGTRR